MVKLKTLTTLKLLSAIPLRHLPSLPGNATTKAINGVNVLAVGECDLGEVACGTGCIPLGSECCGSAGYCDPGEYCTVEDTCCELGKVCVGVDDCDSGKTLCNGGCMPSDGVCCSAGGYCESGESCDPAGGCFSGGSGSGGGSSGGGSSGGGSSSGTCSSRGEDICDVDFCMDAGAVCCGDGDGSYCDAGFYCTPTGCCEDGYTCRPGSAGGGGTCSTGKETCDSNYCMDEGGVCCGDGDGSYCDSGYYCTKTGCCRDGKVCTPGSAGGGGSSSGGGSSDTSSSTTSGFNFFPSNSPSDDEADTSSDLPSVPTPTPSAPVSGGSGNSNNNNNGGNNGSGASTFFVSTGCIVAAIAGSLALFL